MFFWLRVSVFYSFLCGDFNEHQAELYLSALGSGTKTVSCVFGRPLQPLIRIKCSVMISVNFKDYLVGN